MVTVANLVRVRTDGDGGDGGGCEVDLRVLAGLQVPPAPFTPGHLPFWNDPHISAQMLRAHLDPETDAASRRPATIERTVEWLVDCLDLQRGDALLDLGCGPGLYARRFAAQGMRVTGVDYSQRSIDYARHDAREHGVDITYRYLDYLELSDSEAYDAAVMIYYDFGVLNDRDRVRLLENVGRALRPGGRFAFDVHTRLGREETRAVPGWRVVPDRGFWRDSPYLLLTSVFEYPDEQVELDQYAVIEGDGQVSVYRVWSRYYTPEGLCELLEQHGFLVERLTGGLAGEELTTTSGGIGVVARKID